MTFAIDQGRVVEIARAILAESPYGVLCTSGAAGPSARVVQHLACDDDLTVWIGTSRRSRKVAEAREQPEAVYLLQHGGRLAYVALQGALRVEEDVAAREARWLPMLEAFFPAGPAGDDFVLLALQPRRLELMSFADGVHPSPFGLRAATAVRAGDEWIAGA